MTVQFTRRRSALTTLCKKEPADVTAVLDKSVRSHVLKHTSCPSDSEDVKRGTVFIGIEVTGDRAVDRSTVGRGYGIFLANNRTLGLRIGSRL